MASTTTGTVSATDTHNRVRRPPSSSDGSRSPLSDVVAGGGGSCAVYPVFSTVAIRSCGLIPSAYVTVAFSVA